ncbi:Methyltransferase-like protein 17, mitochondrial [Halotydeus destructor]|nr:Methyltransferase-like protein 17, mitochondrial [Halotydeus destructor]
MFNRNVRLFHQNTCQYHRNLIGALRLCSTSAKIEKSTTTAFIDEETAEQFDRGLRHKSHPGKRALKSITLPAYLERAALRVVEKYKTKQFRNDVHRMYQRVFHHQLPAEADEIREKKREITQKVIARENVDISALGNDEKEFILEKRDKKVNELLAKGVYNWKELEYTEYSSTVYLAARLAGNYAALKSVFQEIKRDDPQFRPRTMFDFGSGIGTTMYAANETWPASISEHFNVELSEPMNEISRFLLRGGTDNQPMFYNGVFYRQFLPVTHSIKYDMVVSAFSLLDLPTENSRINVIENLWNKTQDMLVIVEHGNRDGFKAVLEARNFVLEKEGYDVTKTYYKDQSQQETSPAIKRVEPNAHIVAPCPHTLACPRLFTGGPVLCNFQIPYAPLDIGQRPVITKERFSYIVMRKGPRPARDSVTWPRIVQPVLSKSKHIICRTCCPDGSIKSVTFTKGKHKGHMYETAKASDWGDLLPATVKVVDKRITRWDVIKHERRLLKAGKPEEE